MPLVSDTTALRYLIEIEAVYLLPVLFGQVTIPPAAYRRSHCCAINAFLGCDTRPPLQRVQEDRATGLAG